MLDEMVTAGLLRIFGNQYLPTFRGMEQFDEDVRAIVRRSVNCVLGALKGLYKRSDSNTFSFAAVVDEVRQQDAALDANDILPALFLGEQFHDYYRLEGGRQHDDRLVVEGATVAERILDFTSVENDWPKQSSRDAERSQGARAPLSVIGGTSSPGSRETDLPDLRFVRRDDLRRIIERDYAELQRVRAVNAPKSRYVLCGGLIEALLLDALLIDETAAKTAKESPKAKGGSQSKSLLDWNLGDLIDVALELRIIETDAEQFSHGVRNYRNLIHPGKEAQSQQRVAAEEADISEKVLDIIIRELRRKTLSRP